jgi:hypothetical protein
MTAVAFFLLLVIMAMAVRSQLLSFRAQRPANYAEVDPEFILRQHLSGPILAEGAIFGPTGRVTSTFVAKMNGEWKNDGGTLTENFAYSNGRTQMRKWHLRPGQGNTFVATADDVIGEGKGVVSGSTVALRYRIVLPEDVGGHTLDVTDWMYLTENGTIMNRSEMRKFGVKVAELIATMRPVPAY